MRSNISTRMSCSRKRAPPRLAQGVFTTLKGKASTLWDDCNPDLFGGFEVAEWSSLAIGDEPVGI